MNILIHTNGLSLKTLQHHAIHPLTPTQQSTQYIIKITNIKCLQVLKSKK